MQAHSVAPLCTPSRFALLTGVQPACGALRAGSDEPPPGATGLAPPPLVSFDSTLRAEDNHRALPHKLSALGYTTGVVGLWHVGLPESEAGKKLTKQVLLPLHVPSGGYAPPSRRSCPLASSRHQVRDALPAKWTVAAGGKVKRAVLDEYAAVQVLPPLSLSLFGSSGAPLGAGCSHAPSPPSRCRSTCARRAASSTRSGSTARRSTRTRCCCRRP